MESHISPTFTMQNINVCKDGNHWPTFTLNCDKAQLVVGSEDDWRTSTQNRH